MVLHYYQLYLYNDTQLGFERIMNAFNGYTELKKGYTLLLVLILVGHGMLRVTKPENQSSVNTPQLHRINMPAIRQ